MSNCFSVVGTLGKDAESKSLASGQEVMSFSIACNTGYGDKQKTFWLRCQKWGKATGVFAYLKKGQQVFVSGELSVSEYQKNDGSQGYSIDLNCNSIDLVGKKDSQQSQAAPVAAYVPPQAVYQQHQAAVAQQGQPAPALEDDIPF